MIMKSGVRVTLNIKDADTRYIRTEALPRVGEEIWLDNNHYSAAEWVHHSSDHYLVTKVVHHWVTGSSGGTSSSVPMTTEDYSSTVFVTKIAT